MFSGLVFLFYLNPALIISWNLVMLNFHHDPCLIILILYLAVCKPLSLTDFYLARLTSHSSSRIKYHWTPYLNLLSSLFCRKNHFSKEWFFNVHVHNHYPSYITKNVYSQVSSPNNKSKYLKMNSKNLQF